MDSKVRCEQGVYIVNLSGKIQLDTIDEFKRVCVEHLLDKHTIFNLSELSFVGSTGITVFLDSIRRIFNSREKKIKMVGVSSEFEKIFVTNLPEMIEYYENEKLAFISIFQPERAAYQPQPQASTYNQPPQANYGAVQGMTGVQFQQERAQVAQPQQQVQQQQQSQQYRQPMQQQVQHQPVADTLCEIIARRIRERQILEAEGLAYIINDIAFNNNDRMPREEVNARRENVASEATT